MRRGDMRGAVLGALLEGPAHGYEVITRLESKSAGMWRPSPGSVYPTLQMLEDEGLVKSEERDGKRVYELTESGRAEGTEQSGKTGGAPWEEWAQEGIRGLRKAAEKLGPMIRPLVMAMRQVAMEGDSSKIERASEVLKKATKELYQILSED